MATNPMHQFNVYRIGPEIKFGSLDISFTNASLVYGSKFFSNYNFIFNFRNLKKKQLIPDKIQLLTELSYTFVSKMISDTAGLKSKTIFWINFFTFYVCSLLQYARYDSLFIYCH